MSVTTQTSLEPTAPSSGRDGRGCSGLDFTALWTLYLLTLRQNIRGKRWIVMAILFLVPAGLAMFIRWTSPDVPAQALEFMFGFMFIPQALLPLVALLYASGMIQDEQEEQTITYLLIRPITKWALYIVKLLATLTTTVFLTILFTSLTFVAIYFGDHRVTESVVSRCLTVCFIHSLAVIAYCCLFGLISLFTTRTLIVGILYAAIFEGLLANLPLSVRLITVIYYTRIIAYRMLTFIAPMNMGNQDIAANAWQLDLQNDPHLLEHPQVSTCVTVLLASSLFMILLGAFLVSRREFHVKTPEKG
jgi:ABC-2 type transport system permease protein